MWKLSIPLPFYTNLFFVSFKFFLFLGYMNLTVHIFRGMCSSLLWNSSSSRLHELDSPYIPWNLFYIYFKFFLFWATWTWQSIYSVEFVLHFFQILPLIGLLERNSQYIPWNFSFVSFKFFLFWATWTWQHTPWNLFLHILQILPLLVQLKHDSQYIPWNSSFMSRKTFLFLGYLNVTVNIFGGICPFILKFVLLWATGTWKSIYSVEFVFHFFQILLLPGYLNLKVNIFCGICP